MRFWVPGPLPGMNEIVAAAKVGGKGHAYSAMKSKWTNLVKLNALAARIPKGKFTKVRLHMLWSEASKPNGAQRDPDNIEAGQKFVWDGLVEAEILPNDKRANNAGSTHSHVLGPLAGVEVTIEEVSDG